MMATPKLITPKNSTVKKLRVAAYCRVSSSSSDQLHSYERQVEVYTKEITSNPNWELVDIFADEGLSGTDATTRPEFMRMIRMCERHEIDLILTKSLSRFARHHQQTLEYVRKLKLLGVGIKFEKEGINTLMIGDELLLTIFAAIAQEESKTISLNLRHSIHKRMELGEFVDNNAPYGYRLVDKKLEVYEPEAQVVRDIFQMYLNGMSIHEIANHLSDNGVDTKCGGRRWSGNNIAYMLSNERYIGDCLYQKFYRDTSGPYKQYVNYGQEDQYYATDTHPPIIDKDVFEKVQVLRQQRKERFCKTPEKNTYPLSSRIRCAECGSIFRRKVRTGVIKWVCTLHQNDATKCNSYYYDEERIYDGFIRIVNTLRFDPDRILDKTLNLLEAATREIKRNSRQASEISGKIAAVSEKILMLDRLLADGHLSPEVHQAQIVELNREHRELFKQRQDQNTSELSDMAEGIRKLKRILAEIEEPLDEFDDHLFQDIVTEITIANDDRMTMTLLGGMKFTERI